MRELVQVHTRHAYPKALLTKGAVQEHDPDAIRQWEIATNKFHPIRRLYREVKCGNSR